MSAGVWGDPSHSMRVTRVAPDSAEPQSHPKPCPRLTLGVGAADDNELLPVEALRLDPEPSIAPHIGRIGALRDDPFESELAYVGMECGAAPALMVAILERRADGAQERGSVSLNTRPSKASAKAVASPPLLNAKRRTAPSN
jgi:hypothetical protein